MMNIKRALIFVVAILCIAAVLQSSTGYAESGAGVPYVVFGIVSDSQGENISNAYVEAQDIHGKILGNATTDQNGFYSIHMYDMVGGEIILLKAEFDEKAGRNSTTYNTQAPGSWANVTIFSNPELSILSASFEVDTIPPGGYADLNIRVANVKGGTANNITITIDTSLDVSFLPDPFSMAFGEEKEVDVVVTAPVDAEHGDVHVVSIKVSGVDQHGESLEPAWHNLSLSIEHVEEKTDYEVSSNILILLAIAFIIVAVFVFLAILDKKKKGEDEYEERHQAEWDLHDRRGGS